MVAELSSWNLPYNDKRMGFKAMDWKQHQKTLLEYVFEDDPLKFEQEMLNRGLAPIFNLPLVMASQQAQALRTTTIVEQDPFQFQAGMAKLNPLSIGTRNILQSIFEAMPGMTGPYSQLLLHPLSQPISLASSKARLL